MLLDTAVGSWANFTQLLACEAAGARDGNSGSEVVSLYATGEDGVLVHSRFNTEPDDGPLFGLQVSCLLQHIPPTPLHSLCFLPFVEC